MMCQRPNCVYVHPTFANFVYKNQKKKGGKGGPHMGGFGGPHMGGPHGHAPRKPRDNEQAEQHN